MPKPRAMPQNVWDYMVGLRLGSRTVVAAELLIAAWLVEAGYAVVEDDYEGPRVNLTTTGQNIAKR